VFIGRRRKLGGILIEARWLGERPSWVAVGVGVNVAPPDGVARAVGLRPGTARVDVLAALVPAVRRAVALRGHLAEWEVVEFGQWDVASGASCVEPARGTAIGVNRAGELRIATADGITVHRIGSLVFDASAEGGA
jgi:biotin-(acetyl-CoA carboxylase) ligase